MFIIKAHDKYAKLEQIFDNFQDANNRSKELASMGWTVQIESMWHAHAHAFLKQSILSF